MFFKRRFKGKFIPKRYGGRPNARGRYKRKARSLTTTTLNAIKQHGPTMMKFAYSFFCKQPLPDRFFTWMHYENFGHWASGLATGQAGFGLNILPLPLNNPGALITTFPNPSAAINASNPSGLKNLLFNGATSTGIWQQYKVWSTRVELTLMPQATVDTVTAALTPVNGANAYGTTVTAGQGPGAIVKICEANVSSSGNTLTTVTSSPQLLGVPKKLFEALADASGTAGAVPVLNQYFNLIWNTINGGSTTAALGWNLRIAFHVEFYNRVDTALLDN